MLTIKIDKRNGYEELFEATEVTKEPKGLLIQTDKSTNFYGRGGNQYALDSSQRDPMCNENMGTLRHDDDGAIVYIMNSHGKTVAHYYL